MAAAVASARPPNLGTCHLGMTVVAAYSLHLGVKSRTGERLRWRIIYGGACHNFHNVSLARTVPGAVRSSHIANQLKDAVCCLASALPFHPLMNLPRAERKAFGKLQFTFIIIKHSLCGHRGQPCSRRASSRRGSLQTLECWK